MNISDAVTKFSALDRDDQLIFLAKFGHNLTIVARDTFVPQSDGVHSPERLRKLSELQHRIFSHIHDLLSPSEGIRPDDVIVSIMLEQSDERLKAQTSWAFDDALKRVMK